MSSFPSALRQTAFAALALTLLAGPLACSVEEEGEDAGTIIKRDGGTDAGTDGGEVVTDGGVTDAGPAVKEVTDALCGDNVDNDSNNFKDCSDFSCVLGVDVTVCATPPIKTVTIEDLQKEPATANHPPPTDKFNKELISKVLLTDVVVSSPSFTTSGSPSFFIADAVPNAADAAQPWKGIFVFARGLTTAVQPGDKVTIKGLYYEYLEGSQIEAQVITPGGTAIVPAPLEATVADLAGATTAEQFEGVLVKVKNVRVAAVGVSTGGSNDPKEDFEISAAGSLVKFTVGNLLLKGADKVKPAANDFYESISGVVHYHFGRFRLEIRAKEDAVAGTPPEDADNDGIADSTDNCPAVFNPLQENVDGDTVGDACDNCPTETNEDQSDGDNDKSGNVCDNCPTNANVNQSDVDDDGDGDVCDTDSDDDGRLNGVDSCPLAANPAQENSDNDARGDACDNCPALANDDQADTDHDGIGDLCDAVTTLERAPAALGELVINEFMADPPPHPAGDANGDGAPRDSSSAEDEFVELVNATADTLLLDGVFLETAGSASFTKRFTFPAGTRLEGGKAVVIFGGGDQTKFGTVPAQATAFGGSAFFSSKVQGGSNQALVLANGGGKIQVSMPGGAAPLVLSLAEYAGTLSGDTNSSINRDPDVTGTTFKKHTDVNASLKFSPGTKTDGTSF